MLRPVKPPRHLFELMQVHLAEIRSAGIFCCELLRSELRLIRGDKTPFLVLKSNAVPCGCRKMRDRPCASPRPFRINTQAGKAARSPLHAWPFHWAAGSDGEMNFGTTSLAAPHAVSSRVARYSFTARLDLAGSRSLRQS